MGVGTFGNGTAVDLTIPDLGTLRTECSAGGFASITLDGGAPFDIVKVTDEDAAQGQLNRTTYSNSGPDSLGTAGAELWLSNVQGQWRFEYYVFDALLMSSIPCRVGAEITRIS